MTIALALVSSLGTALKVNPDQVREPLDNAALWVMVAVNAVMIPAFAALAAMGLETWRSPWSWPKSCSCQTSLTSRF